MKIKYVNFENGLHEIDLKKDEVDLGFTELVDVTVSVLCNMDKSDHQIVLNCNATFNMYSTCDRCLDDFNNSITTKFTLVKVFDENNVDPDDLNCSYLPKESIEIDLSNDVFDFIQLTLPMKKICAEECKGLCPTCGVNLNNEKCTCSKDKINPQWNELLKLKDKLN